MRILPITLSVIEDITTIAYYVDIFLALGMLGAIHRSRFPFACQFSAF